MPASIGVNLRVTGHCRQGGRKYMEDFFSVAYQQTEDEKDLEYAFFGIYDGHGGAEAAAFAKEHLMESIVKHKNFWSDDDEEVLRSIKDGFIATHYAMWRIHATWPKTSSGLPSTAGTTASIAFIRRGKVYIGHVGDSGITLGYQEQGSSEWKARPLTREHKPESEVEMARIQQSGGKVVSKSGVPRVVWNRPSINHKGPVRRSTPIDEIPFLAVARSLGDLWSYNSALNEFVVSPQPDVLCVPIDTETFRCLIFGTDGLYNMLSPSMAVRVVQQSERHNEQAALSDCPNKVWINPSKCLVEKALDRWSTTKMRADNTSVITLMLDPPGPPKAEVLRNKKKSYSSSGLQIEVTRYQQNESSSSTAISTSPTTPPINETKPMIEARTFRMEPPFVNDQSTKETIEMPKLTDSPLTDVDCTFVPQTRESLSLVESSSPLDATRSPKYALKTEVSLTEPSTSTIDDAIQINEVSSSSLGPDTITSDEENRKGKVKKIPGKVDKVKLQKQQETDGLKVPESRVLRERKNTQQAHGFTKAKDVRKNQQALKSCHSVPPEKKQLLLQSVLFKSNKVRQLKQKEDEESAPSTNLQSQKKAWVGENSSKLITATASIKPDPINSINQSKQTPLLPIKTIPVTDRLATTANSIRNLLPSHPVSQKIKTPPKIIEPNIFREVRKSTLAQKLRIRQAAFKAKLRRRTASGKALKHSVVGRNLHIQKTNVSAKIKMGPLKRSGTAVIVPFVAPKRGRKS